MKYINIDSNKWTIQMNYERNKKERIQNKLKIFILIATKRNFPSFSFIFSTNDDIRYVESSSSF